MAGQPLGDALGVLGERRRDGGLALTGQLHALVAGRVRFDLAVVRSSAAGMEPYGASAASRAEHGAAPIRRSDQLLPSVVALLSRRLARLTGRHALNSRRDGVMMKPSQCRRMMGRFRPVRFKVRWTRGRRAAALAFVAALLPIGMLASGLVVARAAPAAEVTLRLWPAGQGRIEVVQGGKDLNPNPCGFEAVLERGTALPCELTVTTGSPVTLRAVAEPTASVPAGHETEMPDFPVPEPAFVRWSRFDCETAPLCTFTPGPESDGDWVTALFTPLQLQVGVFGLGDVRFWRSDGGVVEPPCPNNVGFGDRTCHAALPADIDVVIETSPAPTGWGLGCEPEGGSATSPRCTLGIANLRTLAFVSFDGQQPLEPPFRLTPRVKVVRGGSGQGRVTGSGFDCPPTCEVALDYQTRVRLRAEESAGSTFVRWVGVCSTDRHCIFSAGSATEVQARFDTATPHPSTTTAPTTTAPTTTTAPPSRPKAPRLEGVAVRGRGAGRAVVFAIIVDRPGRATARLIKQRRMIVSRSYRLRAGRNSRRLAVPRRAKRGAYRLSVRVVAGDRPRTLTARIRLPR
jgi:hypothetical protein